LSAAVHRRAATTFPDDARLRGASPLLYALHRFHLGGLTIMRLIMAALLVLAALWATDALPGGRWAAIPWLVLAALLIWIGGSVRRSDYVEFHEAASPQVAANRLHPDDKVEIYATGQFTVEGKYRRHTWIPGFFRTFATGEHALLCLARQRRWLLLTQSPSDESGMWYAFIAPQEITRIRWGDLRFGANHGPALAVDYRLTVPAEGRRKKELVRAETVYLAFTSTEDAALVLADLLVDHPQDMSGAARP
jgi:hypothetical protein